jgi:hypothetical protein
MPTGCLINLLSSSHPHFRSFLVEGLWGFPDNDLNRRNRRRWSTLQRGSKALLYFEHRGMKGIWGLARVVEVFESNSRVEYWVEDPEGYPLQVRLELVKPIEYKIAPDRPLGKALFDAVKPVGRDEAANLGVKVLKAQADRWSLVTFGQDATYSANVFNELENRLLERNPPVAYALEYIKAKMGGKEETLLELLGRFAEVLAQERKGFEGALSSPAWSRGLSDTDAQVLREAFKELRQGIEVYSGLFAPCVARIASRRGSVNPELALGLMIMASVLSNSLFSNLASLLPESLSSAARKVLRDNLAALLPCPLYNINL